MCDGFGFVSRWSFCVRLRKECVFVPMCGKLEMQSEGVCTNANKYECGILLKHRKMGFMIHRSIYNLQSANLQKARFFVFCRLLVLP